MDTCSKEHAYFFRVCTKEYNTLKVADYTKEWLIESSGFYKINEPDVKDGYFKFYTKIGTLESEGSYIAGKKSGLWRSYREDGSLHFEEDYLEGKLEGKLKSYYNDKSLKREENYKNDDLLNGKCFTHSGKDTAHYPFRETPEFNGGEKALNKWLSYEIRYPDKAVKHGVQGTVRIIFIVDKSGDITDVRIHKSIHSTLNYEAIRIIEKMPKWKPGKIDGEIVATKFSVPIRFVLQ